jgi:threonine dehydratase
MIPYRWIEQARERIAVHIRRTPLTYDPELDVYFKWESHQVTGSFKARGAFNKVFSLQDWELARGIVAASAGNHGQGVALAGRTVGVPVMVFASQYAVPAKLEAMRKLGAELRLFAGGYGEAEKAGLRYAAESGSTWVSPYNDGQVIAGQGTLVSETIEEMPELGDATWLVPVSGGGLISGVGAALKERPLAGKSRLIGVQSEASPFMYGLYHDGSQENAVELPSLADGLAGPVEDGALTIPLVRRYVDEFILVDETEIAHAIRFAWEKYQERIEGSAAVSLAALLSGKVTVRPAVIVISGGNIQPEVHQQIVEGSPWTG